MHGLKSAILAEWKLAKMALLNPCMKFKIFFGQKTSFEAGASIKRGQGGAIVPPYFGRIEGAAGQYWRTALLLAPPVLGSY
jgi:hypothetical protein